jgi:S1-C subfamily serine protease
MEFGTVQRGVLGVMIRTVDSKLAKEKSLNVIRGVYVDSLIEKGAALNAGLKEGDVIYKVNDIDISSSAELQGEIAQYRPGEIVKVHLYRNGKDKVFDVKLRNRRGDLEEMSKEAGQLLKILGASCENISDDMKAEHEINHGIVVNKIYPGKISQQTKMNEGFVITHADNKKVKNLKDLVDLLNATKGGVMLEGFYPDMPDKHYYAIGL